MFERNYAADNFLTVYFGVRYPDWVNHSSTLKVQLYLAIVAQGLVVGQVRHLNPPSTQLVWDYHLATQ